MLNKAIKKALASSSTLKGLQDVMEYAVLPAGKLFRPRLVEAITLDLGKALTKNELHLATALELHHAYTLVHNDLPAMDNDLMRRGKPSTHAQFGEWKAILAGDALLISSFEELMKIDHPNLRELHRFFSWATGAKGLIAGQFLDLASDGSFSLSKIIRIHELRTARLIQVATLGSLLLSENKIPFRKKIHFLRLGREIGVSFQLIDDLSDLGGEISPHEKNINPFVISPTEAQRELTLSMKRLKTIVKTHQLTHLEDMLKDYFTNAEEKMRGMNLPVTLSFDFFN